jgi:hypothetical protein
VPECFELLHPDTILRVEGLGLPLAFPDDDRCVGGIRFIGDEVEAAEPGGREQQGKNSRCPRWIVSWIVAGLTVRRSTMVYISDSFARELSGVAVCALARLG